MSDTLSRSDADVREYLDSLKKKSAEGDRRTTGCPDLHLLLAAREGVLPPEIQSTIQDHARQCTLCRVLQDSIEREKLPHVSKEQLKNLGAHLHGKLSDASAPEGFAHSLSLWIRRLAPVATALLLVLSLGLGYRQFYSGDTPLTEILVPASAPAADPASLVRLEPAPVELPLDALLIRRDSGANEPTLYIRQLAEALAPYQKGDYLQASSGLAQMAHLYPNAPEVPFFQGICLLFLDKPGEAVRHLSREDLYRGTSYQRKASWYLGIAYLHLGNTAGAMKEFRKLCQNGGERKTEACEAAESLSTLGSHANGK